MHECPECGQACDCDGEDTWIGYPYNLDCTHDCEDEWREDYDNFDDDYDDDYEYPPETLPEKIIRWIKGFWYDIKPFRCDMCRKWSLSKHRPCCSQKCTDEWVPF